MVQFSLVLNVAPSTVLVQLKTASAMSRLEMLRKWKEERELKRKLEAMERARSKPGFKVMHMAHSDLQLFQTQQALDKKAAMEAGKVSIVYYY